MGGSFTEWRTPRSLFDRLNEAVGGFAIDAAADSSNHLVERWYGPGGIQEDALEVAFWNSPAWCNPPYGKGIEQWLHKFIEQGKTGVNLVTLLPARVETRWWADLVVPAADIIFLTGRVPFERPCEKCGLKSAELKGWAIDDDIDGPVLVCADCAFTVGDPKPFHTAPDHASAIVIYGPSAQGQVGWLDWRKTEEKTLKEAA